ncbi:Aste57867_24428 [Aphanomyces stellatus]|uniref:Aste57867_24428 protein n=1 Tax=Aphanomyces stellatus TaxID=120398 RepID=A0A485LRH0_9STRA|nr:hypothetical protein As57867_024352 [Aphanomyces stellatus]VFU01068.1 Aste57867_24428 [Aphanomyces stellatus]
MVMEVADIPRYPDHHHGHGLRAASSSLTAQVMGMRKITSPYDTKFTPSSQSQHDVTQEHRTHYVRRLFQEVVKVHTMLRASFDKTSVHDTCRAHEQEIWEACASPDEYTRQMRIQIQSIAKKGRGLLQQRGEVDFVSVPSSPAPPSPTTLAYERHVPSASPELSMRQMQQAHIRRALSNSWMKTQRKASRFRWATPLNVQEEAYVHSVQKSANTDILQSIRNLYYNQLTAYEEQLRLSLVAEHRDWVAFDLSVVQSLLATLDPLCEIPQYHHNIQTLHCQIEKVLKEKALFDYMWEMERSKSFDSTSSPASPSDHI